MKCKVFAAALTAAILVFALTACGKTQTPTASDNSASSASSAVSGNIISSENASSVDQQSGQQSSTDKLAGKTSSTGSGKASDDESWKKELEEDLFDKYGVIPDHYVSLGNGIYEVYVEVGGKVIPFVTVDSATGDYHG